MQLAILHHHLNRGGVTSVIANHLRSLATLDPGERPERVVVFYDGQRDGWPSDLPDAIPLDFVVEPGLGYDPAGAEADPAKLSTTLAERFATTGLSAEDTLLHVHNHSLGKNSSLPGALARLAGDGWRMLLQVHDFAEDNRPENYQALRETLDESDADRLGAILYPQGPGVHYATLTERDAEILRTAGVAPGRLHTLPNPVAEFDGMPSQDEAKRRVFPLLGIAPDSRLIVYPVRGIRRKNLGEMLLLAALAPAGTYFAVTLRPKNPIEAASFERWRSLAESLDLPCRFDTGGDYGCDFKDILAAADAILTTSVAEGFGMVFLEAWLAGKPLIGRDLPDITREFKAAGMRFDGMWSELRAAANLDEDFGRLTAGEQVEIVRATTAIDPPLDLGIARASSNIAANAAIVRDRYSITELGRRLIDLYGAVQTCSVTSQSTFSGGRIVEHFSDPKRLFPVRSEAIAAGSRRSVAEIVFKQSTPLEPLPTGEDPFLPKLAGVRAVVFDVYGTLLVSGSGDISLASEGTRGGAALDALRAVLGEPGASASGASGKLGSLGGSAPVAGAPGSTASGEAIVAALHDAIHAAHAASSSEHPEVEIREVWRTVLDGLGLQADDGTIERLAVEYECRVNPIWPMPGMAETLDGLRGAGVRLGIVSNAQFFTPLAFGPLSGKSLESWGFEPELCVWSYEHGEAKPGVFLYQRCVEALKRRGVRPEEAVFVGNDLRNDIWPAQQVGFKTALFAGDARSLRWRRDDDRLLEVRPDAVVTDLRQLLGVVL